MLKKYKPLNAPRTISPNLDLGPTDPTPTPLQAFFRETAARTEAKKMPARQQPRVPREASLDTLEMMAAEEPTIDDREETLDEEVPPIILSSSDMKAVSVEAQLDSSPISSETKKAAGGEDDKDTESALVPYDTSDEPTIRA